jgi:hypothetical protein
VNLVPIDSVRPSTYNPRSADPRRLDLVALSLRKLGFVLPLYADAGGELLSGHQRHLVAQRLGLTHVPVARVPAMDLPERKAVNIAFNRGTNDFSAEDTPASLTAVLEQHDPHGLAAHLPDCPPERLFRCLDAVQVDTATLTRANAGRWVNYARNVAATLLGKGVAMPVICTPDNLAVNGIGRLQAMAERKAATVPVVYVSPAEADFARVMLNHLSMDFDIHTRYADVLRYNSFRRPRGRRSRLGRCFTFALLGRVSSKEFDITDPADLARWKATYGTTVCDFGAGLLDETRLLQAAGIDCTPFEPFLLDGGEISAPAARELTRRFLARIATGVRFDAVFLSAVLNSVPFLADRRHVVCIVAALCGPRTRVYACSSSTRQAGYRIAAGADFANHTDSQRIQFRLDYEPRVTLGDFGSTPKVQKYHTPREWYDLWHERFESVRVSESSNNVECVCSRPRPILPADLAAALSHEFDLPYPDGSRLGLVSDAVTAFARR